MNTEDFNNLSDAVEEIIKREAEYSNFKRSILRDVFALYNNNWSAFDIKDVIEKNGPEYRFLTETRAYKEARPTIDFDHYNELDFDWITNNENQYEFIRASIKKLTRNQKIPKFKFLSKRDEIIATLESIDIPLTEKKNQLVYTRETWMERGKVNQLLAWFSKGNENEKYELFSTYVNKKNIHFQTNRTEFKSKQDIQEMIAEELIPLRRFKRFFDKVKENWKLKKSRENPENKTYVNITIDRKINNGITEKAKKLKMSKSALIERIIENYLNGSSTN